MVSEDIEMSRIPREEVDQEMETANSSSPARRWVGLRDSLSPPPGSLASPPRMRMPNTEQDEEKEILIFLKKLRSKSLFEALQFHKENFLECPESDENVSTLPLVKRTIKDAFVALVLFLMR